MRDDPRPILQHLEELRRRIIWSMVVLFLGSVLSFVFYDQISVLLERPFERLNSSVEGATFFIGTVVEGFLTRLRVSLFAGLLVSLPFHVFNGLRFVLPGLRPGERRAILVAILVSFVLIVASAYYGYSIVAPLSVNFLTSAGFVPSDVGIILNYQTNVTYLFKFLIATLVVFQVPILLEIALMLDLVSRRALMKASRYVIVSIFALSAVITPPDFVSQLTLAIPLIGLYFLSILIARVFGFGGS